MEARKEGLISRLFAQKGKPEEPVKVIDESTVPTTGRELPQTILSLNEVQVERYSEQEKKELEAILNSLPPLRIGELNFAPFEAGLHHGGYYVRIFIRNGRDLEDDLMLVQVKVSLIDASGDKVASGTFKIPRFGSLQFGESRPWTFLWKEHQSLKKDADFSSFTIALE